MNGPSKRKARVETAGTKRFRSNLMALDDFEVASPVRKENEDKAAKQSKPAELLRSIVLGHVRARAGIQTPLCLLFRKRVFRSPREEAAPDLAATFQLLMHATQCKKLTDSVGTDSATGSTDSSRSSDCDCP